MASEYVCSVCHGALRFRAHCDKCSPDNPLRSTAQAVVDTYEDWCRADCPRSSEPVRTLHEVMDALRAALSVAPVTAEPNSRQREGITADGCDIRSETVGK
jgi:hypothetical protein